MAYINTDSTKKARKIVNEIGKKYGFKFSVRKKHHSTLIISLQSGRKLQLDDLEHNTIISQIIAKHGLLDVTQDIFFPWISDFLGNANHDMHNKIFWKYQSIRETLKNGYMSNCETRLNKNSDIYTMFTEIEKEVKKELNFYNNDDTMTDYFDRAFFLNLDIGKWDKPYQEKEIKTPFKSAESANYIDILFNGETGTFKHTRTHELLNIVKIENLPKETFKGFSKWIKEQKIGYYSRYCKGFILA